MKVVVATDSFKESLTSIQAGEVIKEGVLSVFPAADVKVLPIADGGEGTAEALTQGLGGEMVSACIHGPLGERVRAFYGVIPLKKMAVIEIAQAAGLALIPPDKRSPMKTSTYGVGELILDAMDRGYRQFIIGLGGSATNDAGIGMLQALGCRFFDSGGEEVPGVGENIGKITAYDDRGMDKRLTDCVFHLAADVINPLCGPNGASAVFGPQKGAGDEEIALLDKSMESFARMVSSCKGKDISKEPGTGAAGGLGYGFVTFLNAEMRSGIEIILDVVGLEDAVKDADYVITGEGRLDAQTVMGKAPVGVAKIAKKHGATVLAFSGCASDGAQVCNEHGIDAFFPIISMPITVGEALDTEKSKRELETAVHQVFCLIREERDRLMKWRKK